MLAFVIVDMYIGCGTDIIEISRIKSGIEKLGDKFLERIFTDAEIEYCESKGKQKYQHYAARFAVKEAALKAISNILVNKYEVGWKDFEVSKQISGKPQIFIKNINYDLIENIDVSISHCKEYAIANVVVLFK